MAFIDEINLWAVIRSWSLGIAELARTRTTVGRVERNLFMHSLSVSFWMYWVTVSRPSVRLSDVGPEMHSDLLTWRETIVFHVFLSRPTQRRLIIDLSIYASLDFYHRASSAVQKKKYSVGIRISLPPHRAAPLDELIRFIIRYLNSGSCFS